MALISAQQAFSGLNLVLLSLSTTHDNHIGLRITVRFVIRGLLRISILEVVVDLFQAFFRSRNYQIHLALSSFKTIALFLTGVTLPSKFH